MTIAALLLRLRDDARGTLAIETAIVAPTLILLALGAFQASTIVARQAELQGAVQEAQSVALAIAPETEDARATLKGIIATSTGLPAEQVAVEATYRCGSETGYVASSTTCGVGNPYASYVRITLTDTYTPTWVNFGVGGPINLEVERLVIIKQANHTS